MDRYLITIENLYEAGPDLHSEIGEFATGAEAAAYARDLRKRMNAGGGGYALRLPLPVDKEEQCRNCRYYHGRDEIVCALHPYGPSSENCFDYENWWLHQLTDIDLKENYD